MKVHTDIDISALEQVYSLQHHPIVDEIELTKVEADHIDPFHEGRKQQKKIAKYCAQHAIEESWGNRKSRGK